MATFDNRFILRLLFPAECLLKSSWILIFVILFFRIIQAVIFIHLC